jgi:hypothetical protein
MASKLVIQYQEHSLLYCLCTYIHWYYKMETRVYKDISTAFKYKTEDGTIKHCISRIFKYKAGDRHCNWVFLQNLILRGDEQSNGIFLQYVMIRRTFKWYF